ncbi:TorF family putative porin [uncultured Cocleimonas sp.]|uniref:TorF family putative porin n=1 Tax=uncultured Cocleimonas sp. TaxID=1051587 RepID=UPI002605B62A|nr:TorF family putative porin [uncultured Cocleimonas sp.]
MKITRKLLVSSIAASLISVTTMSTANAEVSASVGIANMYLWRGIDLGSGDPAVSGDLKYSTDSGLYAGIWGSSGDSALGTEYDLFAGWGGKLGPVNLDVSLWSYNYASSDIDPGELTDLVVSAGIGDFTGTLYEAVQGDDDNDYRYITLGYDFGKFNATVGVHDYEETDGNPAHLQLGYSYNDNLSFAVSQYVADEDSDAAAALGADDDMQFLVSYSFDIK